MLSLGVLPLINVSGDDNLTDLQARGKVSLRDGRTIPIYFDLAEPLVPSVLEEATT